MQFRILGPLDVVDDGGSLPIRPGKDRALLAYLLLHANEVVPTEQLVDELWGEQPPPTAAKVVQNAVSHLRKQLGDARLATRDSGYRLDVRPGELDAEEFERLARTGRRREALALWRGPALIDLREERFADDARRRLEDSRLAVVVERIDEDLAGGRNGKLISELEALIAVHPLHEHLYGQLMTALYRAGRQADALEVYTRARRTLSEELGLEPGPELQELQHEILTHDRALTTHPHVQRTRRRAFAGAFGAALLILAGALVWWLLAQHRGVPIVVRPNSLVAVDPGSNRVVATVPVGVSPRGMAVGRDTIWVGNATDGTVSRVDTSSMKVTQTIGIGAQATELVIARGAVWVSTGLDNALIELDARTGGTLSRRPFAHPEVASADAVARRDGAVWATSAGRVYRLDLRTDVMGEWCCADGLRDIAIGNGAVWINDVVGIERLSPRTMRLTGQVRLGPLPMALTVGFGSVWIAAGDGQRLRVWRVDSNTLAVREMIAIGNDSANASVDLAAGADAIWATDYAAGNLVRIDPETGSVTERIHIGAHPRGVAIGLDRVWVTVD